MDVQFGSTMEAIVKTMDLAHLSKDSDNPQVFEVKFKLPNMGYSSRSDFYRLVFDPNHLDNLGFAGDSLFLYQGDGFFDKMVLQVIHYSFTKVMGFLTKCWEWLAFKRMKRPLLFGNFGLIRK